MRVCKIETVEKGKQKTEERDGKSIEAEGERRSEREKINKRMYF